MQINEREISWEFIRASGPGGQNVNKVASAVQLRFDARNSPSLPEEVRKRLILLAGRRSTKEGVIIITARRFRSQEQNRLDALSRLTGLLCRASEKPRIRRATKPTHASRIRRGAMKRQRSKVKGRRRAVLPGDD
ncbi:MAG: alternative ribosome rescue aminoacyl-tRNA hydrolase ArfB [Pseudomonadota bacterium]